MDSVSQRSPAPGLPSPPSPKGSTPPAADVAGEGAKAAGSGTAEGAAAEIPGSGMALGAGTGTGGAWPKPGSGMAAVVCEGAVPEPGSGMAPLPTPASGGLMGKSVWHFEHFSFAPPGGTRLSSIL